uniref:HAT C-terminal dimerisation domain-containing protein n=1 Tax=Schizaphis graminum TaxID=13262 RepID=A0A2S2P0Z6_SCHGA
MVGQHNGVYAFLSKEVKHLILVRCVCHSIQLAVSTAAAEVLPDHLEYLLSETYNWFCKSSLRQLSYQHLYKTINDGIDPLKIVRVAQTRWLSIEIAVSRILEQWQELKQHFQITGSTEKCYKAKTLYNMYCDTNNEALLIFLKPILAEAQHVNKMFQSNSADPVKLLNDLVLLIQSLGGLVITPGSNIDILNSSLKDNLHPRPYLGLAFEETMKKLRTNNCMSVENDKKIRGICVTFVIVLVDQLKKRLPDNIETLKNISLISPTNCLNPLKGSLTPLAKLMHIPPSDLSKIEIQWRKLHLIQWININSTKDFWKEVGQYRDSSGDNPFLELINLTKCLLVLPFSNGEVERSFSQLNIIKNCHRNRMCHDMTNAILTIRSGLRRVQKCCHNYVIPRNVLEQIGTLEAYKPIKSSQVLPNIEPEELVFEFDDPDDPDETGSHYPAVISIPEY